MAENQLHKSVISTETISSAAVIADIAAIILTSALTGWSALSPVVDSFMEQMAPTSGYGNVHAIREAHWAFTSDLRTTVAAHAEIFSHAWGPKPCNH